MAGDDVPDAERGEGGGLLSLSLIAFDAYLIIGDLLALLAQNANHIHRGAGGKAHGYKLGRLGPGVAGGRVDDDVVSAVVIGDPLHSLALRVGEIDLDVDHDGVPLYL